MTPAQEKLLNEVHKAIVGNKELGHVGVIERLEKNEVALNAHRIEYQKFVKGEERFKNRLIGGSFAASAIFSWLFK